MRIITRHIHVEICLPLFLLIILSGLELALIPPTYPAPLRPFPFLHLICWFPSSIAIVPGQATMTSFNGGYILAPWLPFQAFCLRQSPHVSLVRVLPWRFWALDNMPRSATRHMHPLYVQNLPFHVHRMEKWAKTSQYVCTQQGPPGTKPVLKTLELLRLLRRRRLYTRNQQSIRGQDDHQAPLSTRSREPVL